MVAQGEMSAENCWKGLEVGVLHSSEGLSCQFALNGVEFCVMIC
jgi:hypothetical protein